MTPLLLKPTKSTPLVLLDPASNSFTVIGDSLPENAPEFYGTITDWLAKNLPHVPAPMHWRFRLHYFNTSSMKGLYRILAKIKADGARMPGHVVVWDVEDDDEFMFEAGESFREILDMDIQLRAITEEASELETRAMRVMLERMGTQQD